jgi:hypothetical protein
LCESDRELDPFDIGVRKRGTDAFGKRTSADTREQRIGFDRRAVPGGA